MFGVMGLSAVFANAACAKKKAAEENIITLIGVKEDPSIYQLSCVGEITIESVKNGEVVIQTYSDLTDTQVSIQADADSDVIIKGEVKKYSAGQYQGWGYADLVCAERLAFRGGILEISGISGIGEYGEVSKTTEIDVTKAVALQTLNCDGNTSLTSLDLAANVALQTLICEVCTSLTSLDLAANAALQTLFCSECTSLTSLDLAANVALQKLGCYRCTSLMSLDLAANVALQTLNCGECTSLTSLDLAANVALQTLICGNTSLTSLDLSANTALTSLSCNSCTGLTEIKYNATNSSVSTSVAGAISNATAADGTVYTDSAADYYSTIADAATAKGWTIEQL